MATLEYTPLICALPRGCIAEVLHVYLNHGAIERRTAKDILTAIRVSAESLVSLLGVASSASRRVLAWKLSITMEASFCIEALEEAQSGNDKKEISSHLGR